MQGTTDYYNHDQSTVNSPTQEQFQEKQEEHGTSPYGQGQTTATGVAPRSTGFMGILERIGANPIITYGLRALQLIFAIVTLALAGRSLNKYWSGEPRMRFTSFCGALTLIYLIILFLVAFFAPTYLIAGPLMVMEALITIFWLCSFIAVASRYSGYSCKRQDYNSYDSYDGYYSGGGYGGYITQNAGSSRITGCRSGKAAAAFAAFSFLLFLISSLLLFFNVIRRLRNRNNNPQYLFQPGNQTGVRLNKDGLAFSRNYNPDEEQRVGTGTVMGNEAAAYDDNQTFVGTNNANYNTTGVQNNGNFEGNTNVNDYGRSTNEGVNIPATTTATAGREFSSGTVEKPGNTYQRPV